MPMASTDPQPGKQLRHGQIDSITKMGSITYINIKGDDGIFTMPGRCFKFSAEDMVMRKLESGL